MISVIIPTYKSYEALELCLKSAIDGQHNKNQIIVVVDGFYDLNRDVLNKYSEHINILDLETNLGACKALNLGVYNAKYDKILLVNDDNVFQKGWDTRLESSYQPNAVIAPNQIEPFTSMFSQFKIENLGRDPKTFDIEAFWKFCNEIEKNTVTEEGSTWPIFMSKIDYIRIGGFDESYPSTSGVVSDWDFFLKCQLSGMKMLRTYNCHFYHFVSLTIKSDTEIKNAQQNELAGHEYANYKWGGYIRHNPKNNLKFI